MKFVLSDVVIIAIIIFFLDNGYLVHPVEGIPPKMVQPPPAKIEWRHFHWANFSDPIITFPKNVTDALKAYILKKDLLSRSKGAKEGEGEGEGGGEGGVGKGDNFAGVIKNILAGGKSIVDFVKLGLDILKFFGIEKRHQAILIDNLCKDCKLFIRCSTGVFDTDNFELSGEDGLIVRFITYLPSDLPFGIGVVNYKCHFYDRKKARWAKIDTFGWKAPKEKLNIYVATDKYVGRVSGSGTQDGRQKQIYW